MTITEFSGAERLAALLSHPKRVCTPDSESLWCEIQRELFVLSAALAAAETHFSKHSTLIGP